MRAFYPPGLSGIAQPLGIVTIAAAAAFAACGGEEEGGPVEGSGYSAELPGGCRDDDGGGLAGDLIEGGTGAEIDSLWVRDEGDPPAPSVNVAIADVPRGTAARDVAVETGDAVDARGVDEGTLGGEPAASISFTTTSLGGELRLRQLFVVRGGRAYAVTMSAGKAAFEEVLPEFDRILESWAWAHR